MEHGNFPAPIASIPRPTLTPCRDIHNIIHNDQIGRVRRLCNNVTHVRTVGVKDRHMLSPVPRRVKVARLITLHSIRVHCGFNPLKHREGLLGRDDGPVGGREAVAIDDLHSAARDGRSHRLAHVEGPAVRTDGNPIRTTKGGGGITLVGEREVFGRPVARAHPKAAPAAPLLAAKVQEITRGVKSQIVRNASVKVRTRAVHRVV
mmetsp:Transcript_31425/g.57960  ORF Transcript_31425/g.57960 Transcript_31425/m.57960 type:complete len:205 (+) Transcript_31425:314-928(+)